MFDRVEVFNALRSCITDQKCNGCPREKKCGIVDYRKDCVKISKVLALDVLALLSEPMHSPLYKASEVELNKDGTGSVTYTLKDEGEPTFTVIDSKTGKEADIEEIALHEEWAKSLVYCDMEGWALQDDGQLVLMDECGNYEYADRERFKVIWDA